MCNICVFAGTTEGRELVEFLAGQDCRVTACVATEYGETLLPEADNLTVSAKRLDQEAMASMLQENRFDLVLDATHPYAQAVTENIRSACMAAETPYLRVCREASRVDSQDVYVPDIEAAVDFLNGTEGNILLTTGSKELSKYAGLKDFGERVYARVLPMDSSLASCQAAGLKPARIIAMQGPFTEELNTAMLTFTNARFLVTKDGGEKGGFSAKASAAHKAGAVLVIIGRPPQVEGLSLPDAIRELKNRFGFAAKPTVFVVGVGPGSKAAMTQEVREAIEGADCLIGAKRMLEAVAAPGQAVFDAIAPKAIGDYIENHGEFRRFAVVMSGDTGFFSGTKKLLPLLKDADVRVLPGISSLSCLCARLGVSYEDAVTVSLHGRSRDIARDVAENPKVFALVGGSDGVSNLCKTLTERGLGNVRVSVGQRLSYADETVTVGTAEELAGASFDSLSAVLIENDSCNAVVTHGLPDSAFQRKVGQEGVVPMTKEEVRSVCLSKLRLTSNALCWDIGAGTGSVSIEMAMQAKGGHVYAVERKDAAVELLEENKALFRAENLTVVPGLAPEACEDLPAPTHVFIGGSAGNMREILSLILKKNLNARIVATAIALESVAELTACLKEFPWKETEVVSMTVAKSRKAGPYHLMMGGNPVYVFTMQAGGGEA